MISLKIGVLCTVSVTIISYVFRCGISWRSVRLLTICKTRLKLSIYQSHAICYYWKTGSREKLGTFLLKLTGGGGGLEALLHIYMRATVIHTRSEFKKNACSLLNLTTIDRTRWSVKITRKTISYS